MEGVLEDELDDIANDLHTIHCQDFFLVIFVRVNSQVHNLHADVNHFFGLLVVLDLLGNGWFLINSLVIRAFPLRLTSIHKDSLDFIERGDTLLLECLESKEATLEKNDNFIRFIEQVFIDAVAKLGLHLPVELVFLVFGDFEEVGRGVGLRLIDPLGQVVTSTANFRFNLIVLDNLADFFVVDWQLRGMLDQLRILCILLELLKEIGCVRSDLILKLLTKQAVPN